MPTREAACHCGQLRLQVDGEPFSVSICNSREMAAGDSDFDPTRDEASVRGLLG